MGGSDLRGPVWSSEPYITDVQTDRQSIPFFSNVLLVLPSHDEETVTQTARGGGVGGALLLLLAGAGNGAVMGF